MFESGVPGACFSICLFVCPELRYQMAREQRAETSPQQRMVGRKHPWPTAEPRSFGRDWIFPLTSKCFCRKKRGCFSTFGRVSLPQSYRSGDGWQLGLTFWGLESGFKMFQAGHPRSSQIIPDHPTASAQDVIILFIQVLESVAAVPRRNLTGCSTMFNMWEFQWFVIVYLFASRNGRTFFVIFLR